MPEPAHGFGFRTARLTAEVLRDGHDPCLIAETAAILSPKVTAFLPPDLQVASGAPGAEAWLAAASRDATLLTVREGAPLAGFVLLHDAEGAEIMFGYLLAERAWGRGLGTELVAGLVRALRSARPGATLTGGVDPANAASVRVLEKSGFHRRPPSAQGGALFYALDLAAP